MLEQSPSRALPIILIIIGIILLCCKVWLWGIILLAAGAAWFFLQKPTYYVHIETSAGSSNAYSSKDRAHIEEIVNALNDAIISQAK